MYILLALDRGLCDMIRMSRSSCVGINSLSLSLSLQVEGGPADTGPEFDNCKVLHDTLQLSWRVDMDNSRVRFRLCGCTASDPRYDVIKLVYCFCTCIGLSKFQKYFCVHACTCTCTILVGQVVILFDRMI